MDQAFAIDDVQALPKMRAESSAFVDGYNLARRKELAPTVDQLLLQKRMINVFSNLAIYQAMENSKIVFRHCDAAIIERTGSNPVGTNLLDIGAGPIETAAFQKQRDWFSSEGTGEHRLHN